MTEQNDAKARFEKRWKQSMEQPELIDAPEIKLDIDLSPMAVLSRMREVDRTLLDVDADTVEETLNRLRDRLR